MAAYEEAQVDYEVALSTYESAVKERESQIEIGKKKAEILNGRFEKWYYIVSSENLKTLQSDRASLIEPVITTTPGDEAAAEARAAAKAMVDRPDVSFPVVDTDSKKETSEKEDSATVEKPSVEKPEVDKPEVDKPSEDGPTDDGGDKMEEVAEPVEEQSGVESVKDELDSEKVETVEEEK